MGLPKVAVARNYREDVVWFGLSTCAISHHVHAVVFLFANPTLFKTELALNDAQALDDAAHLATGYVLSMYGRTLA